VQARKNNAVNVSHVCEFLAWLRLIWFTNTARTVQGPVNRRLMDLLQTVVCLNKALATTAGISKQQTDLLPAMSLSQNESRCHLMTYLLCYYWENVAFWIAYLKVLDFWLLKSYVKYCLCFGVPGERGGKRRLTSLATKISQVIREFTSSRVVHKIRPVKSHGHSADLAARVSAKLGKGDVRWAVRLAASNGV
jgi:hypothetical protein